MELCIKAQHAFAISVGMFLAMRNRRDGKKGFQGGLRAFTGPVDTTERRHKLWGTNALCEARVAESLPSFPTCHQQGLGIAVT